jgi:hypothetical protein
MKRRWVKDYCPYAKDQGFMAVVGNVLPGETAFGFSHHQLAGTDTLNFKTETKEKVTQMKDELYRIQVTKSSAGSVATIPFVPTKTKISFDLTAEAGEDYDIVIIGRIAY